MRIPGPKWGAGRPPLETTKSRCAIRIGRTPRRCAAGASVPLGKAASACALATAAAPPPLRGGGCAPLPPRFPLGKVYLSCAHAHGTASETAFAATPPQISRKLLPRKRLGVPSLSSRGCAEGTLARPQRGNPKGGAALFGQSLPTFCWPESRGPARPERVKGKIRNLRRHKRDNKRLPERKPAPAACEVPRRGKRAEGKRQNFKQTQRG